MCGHGKRLDDLLFLTRWCPRPTNRFTCRFTCRFTWPGLAELKNCTGIKAKQPKPEGIDMTRTALFRRNATYFPRQRGLRICCQDLASRPKVPNPPKHLTQN